MALYGKNYAAKCTRNLESFVGAPEMLLCADEVRTRTLCALPVATASFAFNSFFNQLHILCHFKPSVAHLALVIETSNPHYPLPNMKVITPQ